MGGPFRIATELSTVICLHPYIRRGMVHAPYMGISPTPDLPPSIIGDTTFHGTYGLPRQHQARLQYCEATLHFRYITPP